MIQHMSSERKPDEGGEGGGEGGGDLQGSDEKETGFFATLQPSPDALGDRRGGTGDSFA